MEEEYELTIKFPASNDEQARLIVTGLERISLRAKATKLTRRVITLKDIPLAESR